MKLIKKLLYMGFLLFGMLQISLPYIYEWSHLSMSTGSKEVDKSENTEAVPEMRPVYLTKPVVTKSLPIRKDGYALAELVNEVCKSLSMTGASAVNGMHYTTDSKVKFCPMEKIGSTFWRRVFYVATSNTPKFKQPYNVPPGLAISRRKGFNRAQTLNATQFKFLFVRDPFSRLLSTFIDKLCNIFLHKGHGQVKIAKLYLFMKTHYLQIC